MKRTPWPLLKNQRWSTCYVFGPVIEGVLEAPASKDLFGALDFSHLAEGMRGKPLPTKHLTLGQDFILSTNGFQWIGTVGDFSSASTQLIQVGQKTLDPQTRPTGVAANKEIQYSTRVSGRFWVGVRQERECPCGI
jgi:hypothetical protein